jgi:hypothetical protein
VSRGLFAYQIFVRAQALPTTNNLLHETIVTSGELLEAISAPFPSVDAPTRHQDRVGPVSLLQPL